MNKLYTGSICASDIPKEKLKKANNGKLYLDVNIWVNEEKDQYGNTGSIQVGQTKDEREAKAVKVYLGNFKPVEATQPTPASQEDTEALPF